ncbi:MAG: MarR family winged helix-turn-helix transcriptional regulator [Candidatus Kariarchaeaceae archaeon]
MQETADFWSSIEQLSSHVDDISYRGNVIGRKIFILNYIGSKGQCNMKDIVKNLHLPPSTATRQIDSLVKAKFIKRVIPDHNRRTVELTLDKNGMEVYQWLNEHLQKVIETVLQNYSEEELNTSMMILQEITKNSDLLLIQKEKKR